MSEYTIAEMREQWSRQQTYEHDWTIETARSVFDRALAAHDAEVRASVAPEEPDWEYGTRCPIRECTEPHLIGPGDEPPLPEESVWRRTRHREIPAGPWMPVEQEKP